VDPTRVLYAAHHLIQGQLAADVTTDVDGEVRIAVTESVEDMFGQGHVLIPQYTKLLGRKQGKTTAGQTRIPVMITRGTFPDGTAIGFGTMAQAGDATGAAGLVGDVNNHLLATFAAAGLSAMVNIGVRAPFGSSQNFQPSLQQEYAEQLARGMQQPLNRAIEQRLLIPPTITAYRNDPVTISFSEDISFMSKPVKISR
jgi:type IV secretion system protein VirB10